ncbi:MAG: hypothetical protein LBQ97_02675 [Fusobacteriaceae bacterium]|nr:hypothetical protein [Fusobacteriaceae bacterium]
MKGISKIKTKTDLTNMHNMAINGHINRNEWKKELETLGAEKIIYLPVLENDGTHIKVTKNDNITAVGKELVTEQDENGQSVEYFRIPAAGFTEIYYPVSYGFPNLEKIGVSKAEIDAMIAEVSA